MTVRRQLLNDSCGLGNFNNKSQNNIVKKQKHKSGDEAKSKRILYKPRLNAYLFVNGRITFIQRVFRLFDINICLKSNISFFLLTK